MAVGSIEVTEGSGKFLNTWQRTISAVAREDQYVQLGEPALPTFTMIANGVSAATSSDHLLQIMAGAATYTRITKIRVYQRGAAGGAAAMGMSLVRLTDAGTGGTDVTGQKYDAADTANSAGMTLPTSKGTEGATLWIWEFECEQTRPFRQPKAEWNASDRAKPIIIPAGTSNGVALKVTTGTASVTLTAIVEFTETSFL